MELGLKISERNTAGIAIIMPIVREMLRASLWLAVLRMPAKKPPINGDGIAVAKCTIGMRMQPIMIAQPMTALLNTEELGFSREVFISS